jgi:hypothetical protein
MKKNESRVLLTEDQVKVLTLAANSSGMALSTYLRHCALEAAAARGFSSTATQEN